MSHLSCEGMTWNQCFLHPRGHPGPPAARLSQVSLFSVEATGEGSRGWIRPAFGCSESVKQSETRGKSFFRSPAEFALTLPHLVGGRRESGYYEHFLFIKPELQRTNLPFGQACWIQSYALSRLPDLSVRALPQRVRRGQRSGGIALAGEPSEIPVFLARRESFSLKHGSAPHLHRYRLPHLNFAGADAGRKAAPGVLSRKSRSSFQRARLGMALPEEGKRFVEGLAAPAGVRARQPKPPLRGRPISGRPGLLNPNGHNFETEISRCPAEKEQREVYKKAHMWLSHFKQLRYRHTSSLSRNLLGERKKDICLASAASSYLGRRKLLMFMFHISGAQNRFWCLKWGSGGTCFKYVTVSERSSLITSLSNTAENGLKPKLGRGGLRGTFHNKTLPALTLVFIAHFNYGAQQAFSQPHIARIYNSYA